MIGTTISQYSIVEKLGEGGMGVVYKARDTKLDRDVALKFLPAHLAASEQDKARFVQEAKAAAALNHPNVCSIIDIQEHEESAGEGKRMFIVMEFVDGQTLREKMPSLNPGKAIDIGIQVAEGLAAAHEKGIIHRDVKPENIMVRKDGIAQIMDFGLAKLRGSGSRINRLTKEGSTVGTAGYMSPEQVQGQEADHRSDIFSLGVLLYELFTGELPFKGVHETALMYEIVNVDPAPMSAVKPDLDPELDRIVLECLQKDPDERYNAVKDIAKDLKRFKRESSRARHSRITSSRPAYQGQQAGSTTGRVPVAGGHRGAGEEVSAGRAIGMREIVAWGAAGILLAAAAYLFWRPSPSQPGSSAQIRSSIVIPDSIYVHTYGSNSCGPPVLSPDGRAIVFTGVTPDGVARLYVRMLGESNARALPGTDGGKQPFWSPDGKMVGFFDDGKMKKVDLDGGSPTTIAVVPNPRGGAWGPDGTIVFTPDYQSGLFRVDASGNGTPAPVTSLDSSRQEGTHRWPVFLPDGKHVLYLARSTSESGDAEGDAVYVTALDGSDKKMLVQTSFNAAYAGGYLLFARSSSLFAQRFDLATLSVTGDPMKIEDGLVTDLSYNVAVFTAASNGMLLYQLGTAVAGAAPLVVNRAGKPVLAIEDHNEQDQPRFSPDGKQLAIYIYDIRSRRSNVWIYDLRTAGRRRLTTRSIGDFFPVWSPDGSTIYFRSGGASKGDIYETRTAAGGTAKFVASFADQEKVDDCSPDGKTLLLATNDPGGSRGDLWLLPLTGEKREPVPFQQTKFDEFDGRISRDGKWVAYVSNESGEEEIYLKRFDAPGSDPVKISSGGGETPLWGAGGTELIWINALEQVVSARLKFSGESVEATDLRVLFTLPPFATGYDVSPDGQTFAIARSIDMRQSAPLALVQHWEPATK